MRRQSPPRAAQAKIDSAARKAYLEGRRCVVTGGPPSEVHEILGGSSRHKTVSDPRFWLPVSREGHRLVQNAPKAMQLALKFVYDHENFDLDAFNEMYRIGGKDWPVTWAQITSYMEVAVNA